MQQFQQKTFVITKKIDILTGIFGNKTHVRYRVGVMLASKHGSYRKQIDRSGILDTHFIWLRYLKIQ